jgi:putative transposase
VSYLVVFGDDVNEVLKEILLDIEKRYKMKFFKIGIDKDQFHFLFDLC